jgi:hypothetical protein
MSPNYRFYVEQTGRKPRKPPDPNRDALLAQLQCIFGWVEREEAHWRLDDRIEQELRRRVA